MSPAEEPRRHDECYACPIGSFMLGFQAAQPDAMEHLLNAAQEIIQVARAALDAAETAVEAQRAAHADNRASRVQRIHIEEA
jgi:hypothetical protein